MSRPVLLLDVMDTIVRDPFPTVTPAFFDLRFDELLAAKCPDAWPDFELGHIDEPTLARRYFRDARPVDLPGLRARMREAYDFVPGMEALLAELVGAGFEIHALSNYPVWWQMIEAKLGLSRFLRWSFVSCDTGLRKPDPEAYRHAARALDRAPERCVFVDDRPRNCAAAEALGMRAIVFEGAAALRSALAGGQEGAVLRDPGGE